VPRAGGSARPAVGEPTGAVALLQRPLTRRPGSAARAWPPPAGVGALPRHALAALPPGAPAAVRDRREGGIAGTLGALVHAGAPVLAVAADARARARHLGPVLGGFRLCSHAALTRDPSLADGVAHVVAVDPPAHGPQAAALLALAGPARTVHLAWGAPEVAFALAVLERDHELRGATAAVYRALRDLGGASGPALEAVLQGADGAGGPIAAARALRVLAELGLVRVDAEARTVEVPAARRTSLDRSGTYRGMQGILGDGRRWLNGATAQAA
jgi:single-stranded-DNA-specific exonuclease